MESYTGSRETHNFGLAGLQVGVGGADGGEGRVGEERGVDQRAGVVDQVLSDERGAEEDGWDWVSDVFHLEKPCVLRWEYSRAYRRYKPRLCRKCAVGQRLCLQDLVRIPDRGLEGLARRWSVLRRRRGVRSPEGGARG